MTAAGKRHRKQAKVSESSHRKGWIALILTTFFLFLVVVCVAILGSGDTDGDALLFSSTIQDVSDKFALDITPPDWLFAVIWIAIFIYQLFWLFYTLGLICRRPRDGKGYLYYRPPFVPRSLYIVFALSLLVVVAWIVFWTEEMLEFSFFALLVAAALAITAVGIAAHGLREYGCDLLRLGNKKDVRRDRGLVQNGLGLYAAWLTFAMLLNLAVVLTFSWGVDEEDANTIALSIYGALILVYFVVELAVFSIAMRFIFTPYIVFALSLAAVLSNDWDIGDRNCLITLFLLGFAAFALFFKLASIIYLCVKEPEPLLEVCEKSDDESDSDDEDDDEETARYVLQAKLLLSQ